MMKWNYLLAWSIVLLPLVAGDIEFPINLSIDRGIEWVTIDWDNPHDENFSEYPSCDLDGYCRFDTLSVGNLTVWDNYLNLSVINYNVTGNMSLNGNL